MTQETIKYCRLELSDELEEDLKIWSRITQLGFKILGFSPLVIEKNSTSQQDILKLTDMIKTCPEKMLKYCYLLLNEEFTADIELCKEVLQLQFKIIALEPAMVIEQALTSPQRIFKLIESLERIRKTNMDNNDVKFEGVREPTLEGGSGEMAPIVNTEKCMASVKQPRSEFAGTIKKSQDEKEPHFRHNSNQIAGYMEPSSVHGVSNGSASENLNLYKGLSFRGKLVEEISYNREKIIDKTKENSSEKIPDYINQQVVSSITAAVPGDTTEKSVIFFNYKEPALDDPNNKSVKPLPQKEPHYKEEEIVTYPETSLIHHVSNLDLTHNKNFRLDKNVSANETEDNVETSGMRKNAMKTMLVARTVENNVATSKSNAESCQEDMNTLFGNEDTVKSNTSFFIKDNADSNTALVIEDTACSNAALDSEDNAGSNTTLDSKNTADSDIALCIKNIAGLETLKDVAGSNTEIESKDTAYSDIALCNENIAGLETLKAAAGRNTELDSKDTADSDTALSNIAGLETLEAAAGNNTKLDSKDTADSDIALCNENIALLETLKAAAGRNTELDSKDTADNDAALCNENIAGLETLEDGAGSNTAPEDTKDINKALDTKDTADNNMAISIEDTSDSMTASGNEDSADSNMTLCNENSADSHTAPEDPTDINKALYTKDTADNNMAISTKDTSYCMTASGNKDFADNNMTLCNENTADSHTAFEGSNLAFAVKKTANTVTAPDNEDLVDSKMKLVCENVATTCSSNTKTENVDELKGLLALERSLPGSNADSIASESDVDYTEMRQVRKKPHNPSLVGASQSIAFVDLKKPVLSETEKYKDKDGQLNSKDKSHTCNDLQMVAGASCTDTADRLYLYQSRHQKLNVYIHKVDITELLVDVIVSAGNKSLNFGGGVSKAIAMAAGKKLERECEAFIKCGHTVAVTEIFVSSAGNLNAKYVLHAVGPKWDAYEDKDKCFTDLRRTVLRCLIEARRLGMSSIALPSISSAAFMVPEDICAFAYMEAVKHFDEYMNEKPNSLDEIHFVDLTSSMIEFITRCFNSEWEKPCICNKEMKFGDFLFADQHLISSEKPLSLERKASISACEPVQCIAPGETSKCETRHLITSADAPKATAAQSTKSSRVESEEYKIGRVELVISSKPALTFDVDIIFTVGQIFNKFDDTAGFNIETHGKPLQNVVQNTDKYQFMVLSNPDLKSSCLVCMLYPEPKDLETVAAALKQFESCLEKMCCTAASQHTIKSLVITSNILYQGGDLKLNNKIVGKFAQLIHKHLVKITKDASCILEKVVITANEDTVPLLKRVLDSCESMVDKGPEKSGAASEQN